MHNKLGNHQKSSGYLFALGSTIIWSGNYIIARGLNESIPPISLAFCRWAVAVIVFLPFALKPLIAEWPVIKKHLPYLCLISLLGITIFNTLIYLAGHTTTAANLSLISITFPIFVVILSHIFFGEKITARKWLGILLVVAGVVLLITKGSPSSLLNISFAIGDLWMLLAAFTFAVYSVLLKRKPENISIQAFQLSTFILGLIFLFPFFIWERAAGAPIKLESATIFSILYIGIFASVVAFVLWNKAIAKLGPSKAGMMYYTMPLFSGISATILLNEKITVIYLYSLLLILAGILIANYESKKPAISGEDIESL
jgi:drug/metabolite transporter (DMT)-like permease